MFTTNKHKIQQINIDDNNTLKTNTALKNAHKENNTK